MDQERSAPETLESDKFLLALLSLPGRRLAGEVQTFDSTPPSDLLTFRTGLSARGINTVNASQRYRDGAWYFCAQDGQGKFYVQKYGTNVLQVLNVV